MTTGRINQVAPCGRAACLLFQEGQAPASSQSTGYILTGDFFGSLAGACTAAQMSGTWTIPARLLSSRPHCNHLPAEDQRCGGELFVLAQRRLPPARPRRQSPPAGLHRLMQTQTAPFWLEFVTIRLPIG